MWSCAAQLLIKAKGKKKRKLKETGKVKLNVAITYTPTGGDPSTVLESEAEEEALTLVDYCLVTRSAALYGKQRCRGEIPGGRCRNHGLGR